MTSLLTIEDVVSRFPAPISERTLRCELRRLGLLVRVGKKTFLAERDWPVLIERLKCYASGERCGTSGAQSRSGKRTAQSGESATKKALMLSVSLERERSRQISSDTTMTLPTSLPSNVARLLPKRR